jgi:hypothetical protein
MEKEILKKISNLSKNDQARLIQCLMCGNAKNCNCTDADEDENGFCTKSDIHVERKKK